jgi:hypothetical protein
VLPPFNSDHLGCDACMHAVFVYAQSLPDPQKRQQIAGILATYPQTAHWLAAQMLPLLGDDPYKALRAVSAASVLIMLAGQWFLFRSVLSAGAALLGVLAWQMVCYQTLTANPQLYCVAYFYTQAVGLAPVWLALGLATHPARSWPGRFLLDLVAVLLAAFAWQCHIVSGVVILGGLGLYSALRFLRQPNRADAWRIVLLVSFGLYVILGNDSLAYFAGSRHGEGSVPVKNHFLIFTWVPTLLLAGGWRVRGWFGARSQGWSDEVLDVLLCVLATAGVLQGYCAFEWAVLGTAASYCVLKFSYVTFPVASLIWFLLGSRWLAVQPSWSWPVRISAVGLTLLFAYLGFRVFVTNELRHTCPGPEHDPMRVVRQLQQADPAERANWIYFDPQMPQTSTFVNLVALDRTWEDALGVIAALRGWKPAQQPLPNQLRQHVRYSKLVLPGGSGR